MDGHVEKVNTIALFDRNPTRLATQVSQSPRRAAVEHDIQAEFQRVRGQFTNANGKLRTCWYKGDLRTLARAVNLETEYEVIQRQLSAIVHSSAYALREGALYDGFLLCDLAWRFSFRVLGKFAEFTGVDLIEHERELVRHSDRNAFDTPSQLPIE